MLCKLEENNKIKCANYWDNNNIHGFILKKLEEFEIIDGIILRNFELRKNENEFFPRLIIQLHYTCWEDHGAPDISSFRKIMNLIEFMELYQNNQPVIVHCSAGVGRSGTFISLYILYKSIMAQIKNVNINEIQFSIMDIVRQLKEMRSHLVENEKQYIFLYQFVNILLNEKN
jgi:protein tyrosine phosphatase